MQSTLYKSGATEEYDPSIAALLDEVIRLQKSLLQRPAEPENPAWREARRLVDYNAPYAYSITNDALREWYIRRLQDFGLTLEMPFP